MRVIDDRMASSGFFIISTICRMADFISSWNVPFGYINMGTLLLLIGIIFVLTIHTCKQVSDSDKTPVLCNVVLEGPENDKMNAYISSACRPLSENNCGKTIIKIHLKHWKYKAIYLFRVRRSRWFWLLIGLKVKVEFVIMHAYKYTQ